MTASKSRKALSALKNDLPNQFTFGLSRDRIGGPQKAPAFWGEEEPPHEVKGLPTKADLTEYGE